MSFCLDMMLASKEFIKLLIYGWDKYQSPESSAAGATVKQLLKLLGRADCFSVHVLGIMDKRIYRRTQQNHKQKC